MNLLIGMIKPNLYKTQLSRHQAKRTLGRGLEQPNCPQLCLAYDYFFNDKF